MKDGSVSFRVGEDNTFVWLIEDGNETMYLTAEEIEHLIAFAKSNGVIVESKEAF